MALPGNRKHCCSHDLLTPAFKKVRALAGQYWSSGDKLYPELEEVAKKAGLPMKRFAHETDVRWLSTTAHVQTQLFNDAALAEHRKRRSGLEPKLDEAECQLMAQYCGCMVPFEVATRILDREPGGAHKGMALGSHTLPCIYGLMASLAEGTDVPLPADAGSFGAKAHDDPFVAPDKVRQYLLRGESARVDFKAQD